jgi:hypothetical protein
MGQIHFSGSEAKPKVASGAKSVIREGPKEKQVR